MVETKGMKVLEDLRALGVKVVALKMGVTQPLGLISPTLSGKSVAVSWKAQHTAAGAGIPTKVAGRLLLGMLVNTRTWGILLRPLGELALVGQSRWQSLPGAHRRGGAWAAAAVRGETGSPSFLQGGEECQPLRSRNPHQISFHSEKWFRSGSASGYTARIQIQVGLIPKPSLQLPTLPLFKTCIPRAPSS